MTFNELILSIDVSSSSGKIVFGILISCKTKDYEEGTASMTWEKLKKKFDTVSAPTSVKTERELIWDLFFSNWINSLQFE